MTAKGSKTCRFEVSLVWRLMAVLALVAMGPFALSTRWASASTSQEAASVGFYPAKVSFLQALRGGTFTERVGVIVGGAAPETLEFSTAGAIGPWLSVVPLSGTPKPLRSMVARPGDTDLVLQLKVPPHAADGSYRGVLVLEVPPGQGKKGTTAVGFGAEIEVTAQVTGTELLAARVLNAYTYPKAEVGSAVTFFARVYNSGNVAVRPTFHLEVARAKSLVFNNLSSAGTVQPSSLSLLQLKWPSYDTETAPLGTYRATLTGTFGHLRLGTFTMMFQLVPFGSLHRGGKLLSLRLVGRPVVGGYAEVQASVVSTGEAPEQTNFIGQLYRSGTLLAPVKSLAPLILQPAYQPGDSGVLTLMVPLKRGGSYRLTGLANFAGAQSATKTLTFRVGSAGLSQTGQIEAGAGAAVVVLLLVSLLVARSRHRRQPSPVQRDGRTPRGYGARSARTLQVPPRSPVEASHAHPTPRH
ncbi:MAG: hypothetical protein ACP5VR_08945 [Acidimicrobiales bacterium]